MKIHASDKTKIFNPGSWDKNIVVKPFRHPRHRQTYEDTEHRQSHSGWAEQQSHQAGTEHRQFRSRWDEHQY